MNEQQLHRSNRHVVATCVKRFNLRTIRRELLRAGPSVQGDFRTLDTALTAVAKTSFGIYDDGHRILVAVCLRDLSASQETVEVLFNPWNDGIGYYQFLITPQRVDGPYHFIPYPEAHSTTTEFLRQAKRLAVQAGKQMAVHLEAGIEVPSACDQRMQFNLEWATWIREGIADEIVLKWWFSQNPFIQEQVLPLARKHGVPVYMVDRNNSLNNTPRAIERAVALATDSRLAGFAGYAWYEAANCKRRNTENVPEFRMHIGEAIRQSARAAAGEES